MRNGTFGMKRDIYFRVPCGLLKRRPCWMQYPRERVNP